MSADAAPLPNAATTCRENHPMSSKMSRLLVSVRSADEAVSALEGGADLIDVKEPSRGPLGRADAATIRDIVEVVAGRVPVSAAMGEWIDDDEPDVGLDGVSYLKWGPAGLANDDAARTTYEQAYAFDDRAVLVAYADDKVAGAPDLWHLANMALYHDYEVFLIDTSRKDGSTLTDHCSLDRLAKIFELRTWGRMRVAVAGSLAVGTIRQLLPLQPDWFAVRGAACDGGRNGVVSAAKVRELKAVLAG